MDLDSVCRLLEEAIRDCVKRNPSEEFQATAVEGAYFMALQALMAGNPMYQSFTVEKRDAMQRMNAVCERRHEFAAEFKRNEETALRPSKPGKLAARKPR